MDFLTEGILKEERKEKQRWSKENTNITIFQFQKEVQILYFEYEH